MTENFANIVKQARLSCNMTQAELADKSGLPASSISRIESGRHTVTTRTMKKILSVTGGKLVWVSDDEYHTIQEVEKSQKVNRYFKQLKKCMEQSRITMQQAIDIIEEL